MTLYANQRLGKSALDDEITDSDWKELVEEGVSQLDGVMGYLADLKVTARLEEQYAASPVAEEPSYRAVHQEVRLSELEDAPQLVMAHALAEYLKDSPFILGTLLDLLGRGAIMAAHEATNIAPPPQMGNGD
jgi:hypothetical protein